MCEEVWWALLDLNQRPTDYESAALTAELRARALIVSSNVRPRQNMIFDDAQLFVAFFDARKRISTPWYTIFDDP